MYTAIASGFLTALLLEFFAPVEIISLIYVYSLALKLHIDEVDLRRTPAYYHHSTMRFDHRSNYVTRSIAPKNTFFAGVAGMYRRNPAFTDDFPNLQFSPHLYVSDFDSAWFYARDRQNKAMLMHVYENTTTLKLIVPQIPYNLFRLFQVAEKKEYTDELAIQVNDKNWADRRTLPKEDLRRAYGHWSMPRRRSKRHVDRRLVIFLLDFFNRNYEEHGIDGLISPALTSIEGSQRLHAEMVLFRPRDVLKRCRDNAMDYAYL